MQLLMAKQMAWLPGWDKYLLVLNDEVPYGAAATLYSPTRMEPAKLVYM